MKPMKPWLKAMKPWMKPMKPWNTKKTYDTTTTKPMKPWNQERFPFTQKFRKFRWETTNGEESVPFDTSSHSFSRYLVRLRSFPLNFKMAAQMFILNEILELSVEEEGLLNLEENEKTPILAAVSTYMRRDLNCSKGFF